MKVIHKSRVCTDFISKADIPESMHAVHTAGPLSQSMPELRDHEVYDPQNNGQPLLCAMHLYCKPINSC